MVPRNVLTIKKKSQHAHSNKSFKMSYSRAESDTQTAEIGIITPDMFNTFKEREY